MKNLMERMASQITDYKAEGDIILSKSKSLKISVQNYLLSDYKVSSSQILGVRVVKDNRVGISYTESLDEDSLKSVIDQAIENAEISDENPYEKVLNLSGEMNDILIPVEDQISTQEKIKNVLELEASPKRLDKRVQSVPYNGYTESDVESHYLSTKGRYGLYIDNSFSIYSSVLLAENNKKANFFSYDIAHRFSDLNWKKVTEDSLYHAQQFLQEKPLTTGKYAVKMTHDTFKNLYEVFSGVFSAKSAKDKMNPWGEKLGQMVTSSDITIEDHPLFSKSFRVSKFDSEGVERKALKLVENGVLNTFYHNSVTANYFKTQTTGHASRGPSGPMGISGSNIIIHGKNVKPIPPKYIEIVQMDGLHAGTNRITGDFSLPVKGFLYENGEKVMTFGNITLSGNFYDMMKNLEVNGTELNASTDLSFFTVPLTFNDLSIAGS